MPTALIDCYALRNDTVFVNRVTVAVLKKAQSVKATLAIRNEAGQQNINDLNQHRYADAVLTDPENYGRTFAWNLASLASVTGTTSATVTDATINTEVGNVWPYLVGLKP